MSEHNHQASDGPDYEGCPACIEYDNERLVRDAALVIWDHRGVDIWMDAPNRSLNNATPMQFIRAGDTDRVLQVLDQLASGAFG